MRKALSLAVVAAVVACGSQSDSEQSQDETSASALATRHQPAVIADGTAAVMGRLPETQTLSLDIVLPVRDPAGLDAFVNEVIDPDSASFQQYLTPAEFTSRFGPTQADYDSVVSFAEKQGLDVMGGSRDGLDVQVQGTVSVIETAFNVKMQTYQHPTEDRIFYAPDREPTTTSLKVSLWHISGLDNYSIPQAKRETKAQYAAANGIEPLALAATKGTGSGPSGSFLGSDMRAAYYGGSLTGAGQNLGLFEYAGTDLADLNTYYKNVGQTNKVPVSLLSVDGTSTACLDTKAGGDCDDGEQTLDLTQALGMAPGLASLVMYVGNTDTAILSSMTTHSPLPTTIGCSWGWTPSDASTLDPYFEKMAAQGQSFFVASGDDSTWKKSGDAAAWPADDAYIISVGGTDLKTKTAGGAWSSETAWADSGGGISPDKVAIPSWQKSAITSTNKGSTTYRNGPDVSANANFTFYTCGDQAACQANEYGGTSFAAPMWAAYIALLNQERASEKKAPVGFFLPTIYKNNATASTYSKTFHDITSGKSGSYSAETGFDLVTGWGSPEAGLITSLE